MSTEANRIEEAPRTPAGVAGTPGKLLVLLGQATWLTLRTWIASGFGILLPFRSISKTPTVETVELPRVPVFCLKTVLLVRGLLGSNFILKGVAVRQAEKLLAYLETHGAVAQDRPVPVYDMRTGSREEFIERFVKSNTPVVVQGLSDVEHWSIDWLVRNYGDTDVLFTDLVSGKHYDAPLRDIDRPSEPGAAPYLHNSGRIFDRHPYLFRDLGLDRLRPVESDSFAQQMFVGTKKGTGSEIHCAANTNLFYQLEGSKRWTLVHPEYTLLLYPYLSRRNWYQFSLTGLPCAGRDYADVPLFKYCPRYTVDLKKGDVLLSPSWWYHSVENLTERSLGVATRWRDPRNMDANRLYNFLFFHPRNIAVVIGRMLRIVVGRGPSVQQLFEDDAHDEAFEDYATGAGRPAWGLEKPSVRKLAGSGKV